MPPVPIPQAFTQALQHHQAGRLAEAEALYRQILAAQPDHAEALHFLGVIAHQRGRHDLAVKWISQSLALQPNNPSAYSNLGEAYRATSHFEEAITSYRRALQIKPDNSKSHLNLGAVLAEQGQFDEAIASFRRVLQLNPTYAEAHYNLGNALRERGQLDEALASYHRALQLKSDYPEAYYNLGNTLRERGQLVEAVVAYSHALHVRPDYLEACNNLGNVLNELGKLDEAIAVYHRALQLKPGSAETHNNLGNALRERGQLDRAVTACRRALELKPNYAEAYSNLGNALRDRGELDEALSAYRHGLQLKPDDAGVHSNLVYSLHFHPQQSAETIADEHHRWNRQFSDPAKGHFRPHINDRTAERRLRIGYVSPDFRIHAVGRYLVPLFQNHDHRNFEILCYSGFANPDKITEAFHQRADLWRGTLGIEDEALAGMIRSDGVDILVDLSQHTAGNRLPMFARRLAPVQVSFAGCPGSTGLEAIGYRISDHYLDWEMGDWNSHNGFQIRSSKADIQPERVWLIDSYWCYDPCGVEVSVNDLPAQESGIVTFGSLNNFCKVNDPLLKLWARVLRGVKDARLVLLSGVGSHRQRTLEILEQEGVEKARVEFISLRPHREYLELYHRLDIVLDTFPYNGHTTSLDALWMGVPVVSLAGEHPVSRAGYSQLSNIGLPELVAFTKDDYLAIATRLAADLPRLAELRRSLRSRMEMSPLMDAPRFARNIEAAFRAMWRRWCAERSTTK